LCPPTAVGELRVSRLGDRTICNFIFGYAVQDPDVEVSAWPDRGVQVISHTGLALPYEQVNRNIGHTTIQRGERKFREGTPLRFRRKERRSAPTGSDVNTKGHPKTSVVNEG
jgi:hypothetical protein